MSSISAPQTTTAQPKRDRTYVVSAQTLRAIEAAAPDAPLVPPRRARKVLVYGRVPTHPESVACCFKAMEDPGLRSDGDYALSWIRTFGKGRVFHCTLGHAKTAYTNPSIMEHYLAGIQFAAGDLAADATPKP